jgi:mycothiol system anti-sigma-R factor
MGDSGDHQCIKSLIEIFLYIDDQLDEQRKQEISEHLHTCKKCYGRIEFERMVNSYIKTSVTYEHVPSSVKDKVDKILEIN